jgi:hypothetical protein
MHKIGCKLFIVAHHQHGKKPAACPNKPIRGAVLPRSCSINIEDMIFMVSEKKQKNCVTDRVIGYACFFSARI